MTAPLTTSTGGRPVRPAVDPVSDPDDDLFDDAWQAPKRTNRLTVVLLRRAAGGGRVRRRRAGAEAPRHGAARRRRGSATCGSGGRRARGAGGGGGRQGDRPTAAPGAGSGSGDQGGADGNTAPPVVVGTVRTVDADAIEVTDPTGAVVRVFVPKTATVTTLGLGALAYGMPVAVAGTKGVDGSVEATSVTVRRAGG